MCRQAALAYYLNSITNFFGRLLPNARSGAICPLLSVFLATGYLCRGSSIRQPMKHPTETENFFSAFRQSAKSKPVGAIEKVIQNGPDRELCRINTLAFAAGHELDEDDVIAAFLHGARLGIFDMSWNILCPACGGVLDSGATLKTVRDTEYRCVLLRSWMGTDA